MYRFVLEAPLICSAPAELASPLIAAGASRVYTVTHPELHPFRTIPYNKGAVAVIERLRPAVVLFGATTRGRDLAPRVAQRIGTGLTADCTELAFDEAAGVLLQTRPTFGGNVMATIVTPDHVPQMATVRPGVMPMPAPDVSREGEVVPVEVPLGEEDLITRVLSYVTQGRPAVPIDKAKIIVAGGRGVASREGFALLEELAEVLGAEVAGSRVAVEKGWIESESELRARLHCPRADARAGSSRSCRHRRCPRALYRLRHIRFSAASRRDQGGENSGGHQQRSRRTYL